MFNKLLYSLLCLYICFQVSNETLEIWRASAVTGNLNEVPGVGPAAIKLFKEDPDPMTRVTNTHQLIGQYLMLKGPDDDDNFVSVSELNQKFWFYLKAKGIKAHRSAIVLAISDKVASFFPGLHDANADEFESDGEDANTDEFESDGDGVESDGENFESDGDGE